MLFPVLDGKVVQSAVEELYAAVAGGCEDLVLVCFRPGEIVEGVLRCEPAFIIKILAGLSCRVCDENKEGNVYHFAGTIPFGVNSRM